jgi:prophage regulatory protein
MKKRKAKPALKQKRAAAPAPSHELLLKPEVEARTRLSDTTIWRLEQACRFPKRIKIGFRRVAWRAVDIDAFVNGGWHANSTAQK